MIDTDKCEHILYDTMFNPIDVYNVAEELLAEVKRLRKQVSKAKEWVRSYFINMSGDFNSLEDKIVYDDFMQQMGMKKND